jgi:general L-amino acid transport system substrate-binding protein
VRRRVAIGRLRAALMGLAWLGAGSAAAQPSRPTLETVRERGALLCGIDGEQMGFSIAMAGGRWIGFDVDYCRAIAAAIFDDPGKVAFVPLSATERFDALRQGKVDILARNSTWTLSRDAGSGVNFAAVTYFDGQAFMVRREARVASVHDLAGATVCVERGTTSEMNLADFFRANRMQLTIVAAASNAEVLKAYEERRCVALTADASALYAERLRLLAADRHVVLPEVISKEPLGPAVRHGDDQWLDIARWTHFAMLTAEELGIERSDLERHLRSSNPDVRRLLGVEGGLGSSLGLTNDWAARIINRVGGYGEVFERNLGRSSPLGMGRRLNGLWIRGGLQYAPPIR